MTTINGHAKSSVTGNADGPGKSAQAAVKFAAPEGAQLTPEKIGEFIAELEVPFDPSVIEWRVTNTTKESRNPRGQVIPYAGQRAYADRLNALFSPSGWTRRYEVHTSANFQRGKEQKTVAKVFVTCDLTIFGIGSHSATGEEWTDDENAVTSAEAQAFKRASACFGLGRYLYYFTGMWIDLDDRKRPKTKPKLFSWATPEGWRKGLRPQLEAAKPADDASVSARQSRQQRELREDESSELVQQIEAMAKSLGRCMYRGLLKSVARAWKPQQIQDTAVLQKLLEHMQAADRGLRRLDAAFAQTGPEPLAAILHSLNLKSLHQVNNLKTLQKILFALEAKLASRGE
jgi:hypothetical protein